MITLTAATLPMGLIAALGFMVLMSVITFAMYGIDKKKAQKAKWRIKESTLLTAGLLGGAAGALFGMKFFRHKTKHWYFWAVNIVGVLLHIAVIAILYKHL